MLLDCQLKSLLKNYFKTVTVGFGKAVYQALQKENKQYDLTNVPNINIHAILLALGHKDNHHL